MMFNDHDPYVVAWLRNLYPEADVDGNDIAALEPEGLMAYERVHLFAGIGGWEHALRLAGWADGPVWTGSCPCQPFSAAGKRKAEADERHLWPEFRRLIAECRPPTIFGEQVASNLGRAWLAGVRADLEALGYRVGAADLCAAGVGAPHIRQRLYWVADTEQSGEWRRKLQQPGEGAGASLQGASAQSWRRSGIGGVADAEHAGRDRAQATAAVASGDEPDGRLHRRSAGGLGDADAAGSQGRVERGHGAGERAAGPSGLGFWADYDLIPCGDGKARRIESGTFPLAHGVPARVGRLRAYGNAVVPQAAAAFVRAYMEAR